jgi:hypothetical protein
MTKNENNLNSYETATVGDSCRATRYAHQDVKTFPREIAAIVELAQERLSVEHGQQQALLLAEYPAKCLTDAHAFLQAVRTKSEGDEDAIKVLDLIDNMAQLGYGLIYRTATATDRN